ncbi:PAP2 superfamily protein [compost metagenome]
MPVQQIGELMSSPRKLRNHILKVLGASIILAALAAVTLDQRLSVYFSHADQQVLRGYFREITDLGLSEYYFIVAILAWILAKWIAPYLHIMKNYHKERDFTRRWGLNFLSALIVCGIFIHLTKFFVGRQRPHKSEILDPFVFDPITTHWHWHSFASGHSQVMFTAATMFSVAFPKARWFFFAFAALICFSRIAVLDHFLSDTIMGASIGYCGSLFAMYLMKTKTKNGLF